jgi:ferredoxin--NADP+ reductase
MAYVITGTCCNDAGCVDVCPVDCIHPTPDEPGFLTAESLYIDPGTCIDCGACVEACPVGAIVADVDLTDEEEPFKELNAWYFENRHPHPAPQASSWSSALPPAEPGEPLTVAIVGSGPAGCYAAEALLRLDDGARVHVYERLPVPSGLVRYGVAPDHQDTKAVATAFEHALSSDRVTVHLGVEAGRDVSHEELLAHHHAVIYAVGAPSSRRLGIPGEDLPGCRAATDFVAWYNGHPDAAGLEFDLSCCRAVVVGNGNVGLDVARILAADPADLARTDIADHALDVLRESRIEEVVVLGRRGPAQAAFTTAELLGLTQLAGVAVSVDSPAVPREPADPHVPPLKLELLSRLAQDGRGEDARRRVVLRFAASPVEVLGDGRVEGLRIARNELVVDDAGRVEARRTDVAEELECGLVLRAVGYRGVPVAGLPFDEERGVLPNEGGRVVDPATGRPLSGVYATGWIRRGPSGVIGTNKRCAQETVRALLADRAEGRLPTPPGAPEQLAAKLAERRPAPLDLAAWRRIDDHERARGAREGRPRVKLTDAQALLEVALAS